MRCFNKPKSNIGKSVFCSARKNNGKLTAVDIDNPITRLENPSIGALFISSSRLDYPIKSMVAPV